MDQPTQPVGFKYPHDHPVPDWQVNYDEITTSFRTGDLFLQHGLNPVSQSIEIVENNFWSHVGIVVNPADIGVNLAGNPWCYWESNDLTNLPDVILGTPKEGPTLVNLKDRLTTNQKATYDYDILVRHVDFQATSTVFQNLRSYIDTVHMFGFPDEQEGLNTWLLGRIANQPNPTNNLFCSECVAGSYMAMGLLSKRYYPNGYSPGDFTPGGSVPWINRARLVDAIQIAPQSLGTGPGSETALPARNSAAMPPR